MPSFRDLSDPESLRELISNLAVGIYVSTVRGEILDANPVFLQMFGAASLEELTNRDSRELLDLDSFIRKPELRKQEGFVREFDLRIGGAGGQIRRILEMAYPRLDVRAGEVLFHGLLIDITERRNLEVLRSAETENIRDLLTGAYNRHYLEEFEQNMTENPWSCILVYIDHFRQYSERYGIEAGKNALCRLSRFLMRHARAEDSVVRMGDDEFLILLSGVESSGAQKVAKRIRTAALGQAPMPFSMGWASRQGNESLEKTMIHANQKLEPVRVLERIPKSVRRSQHA